MTDETQQQPDPASHEASQGAGSTPGQASNQASGNTPDSTPGQPDLSGLSGLLSDPAVAAALIEAARQAKLAETGAEASTLDKRLPLPDTAQVPELLSWRIEEYEAGDAMLNFGSAAIKLADSGIAPLVAAARGYRTYAARNHADANKDFPAFPRGNSRQAKLLKEHITQGDILVMPWFTVPEVLSAERGNRDAAATTVQYRPSNPRLNDKGKPVKYEFPYGSESCIGLHPSYTESWNENAPTLLVAEGLLKADAALSAWLHHCGYDRDALSYDGTFDARERLRDMLAAIPDKDRIVIYSIVGSGNWHKNPEWTHMAIADREVWIGMDADVATNRAVHAQATMLWDYLKDNRQARRVGLLSPNVVASDDGEMAKAGVDDYLAKIGTWADLVAGSLAFELPPAPEVEDGAKDGEYRMNEDGTALLQWKEGTDDFGRPTGYWNPVVEIGGRIISMGGLRTPRPEEMRSGVIDPSIPLDEESRRVQIEITWAEDGQVMTANIEAPTGILNYLPDQWARHQALIPDPILRHPSWPVRGAHAEGWVSALKSHREDEIVNKVHWDVQGWVPVRSGIPAYIVGEQVLTHEASSQDTYPGIGEGELSGVGKFGVGDLHPNPNFEDPEYREQVADDIRAVLDTFIVAGAWTNKGDAATALGIALRPALPLRPKTSVYIVGPRRGGKSFTAGAIMSFWARNPGDWDGDNLPGSAKDTPAAMETSVARSVIYVFDDLAPSESGNRAEQEQDAIGTLVRNVFNNQAKSRMTSGMVMRKKQFPRALPIVTAENAPSVASVIDRCITMRIQQGSLPSDRRITDDLVRLCGSDGAPARVSQAMIRFMQYLASQPDRSWADVYEEVETEQKKAVDLAAALMERAGSRPDSLKRHADLASDAILPIVYLRRMAHKCGVEKLYLDMLSSYGIVDDICRLVAFGEQESNLSKPGVVLLNVLNSLLASQRAHLTYGPEPKQAPPELLGITGLASRLGWRASADGSVYQQPSSASIGVLADKAGHPVVYFDSAAAFNEARRNDPAKITGGMKESSTWRAMLSEGFIPAEFLDPGTGFKGRVSNNKNPIRGVPIYLETLLNPQPLVASPVDGRMVPPEIAEEEKAAMPTIGAAGAA